MNTAKIKFNNKDIEVKGCYPYLVSQTTGKVVLRITASEEDASFDDLHALADNESGIVEYYERTITIDPETQEEIAGEWMLKTTYEDYNSGEVAISYQNSQYEANVTKVDGLVKDQAQLRADIDYISVMANIPLI